MLRHIPRRLCLIGGSPTDRDGLQSGRLADAQRGLALVVRVSRVESPIRRPFGRPACGGRGGPIGRDPVGRCAWMVVLGSEIVVVTHVVTPFGRGVGLARAGSPQRADGSSPLGWRAGPFGRRGQVQNKQVSEQEGPKQKEPLPQKRLLDGSRPCQCLFIPSRVPPGPPWRWRRGRPCCTPATRRQWIRPWARGPGPRADRTAPVRRRPEPPDPTGSPGPTTSPCSSRHPL